MAWEEMDDGRWTDRWRGRERGAARPLSSLDWGTRRGLVLGWGRWTCSVHTLRLSWDGHVVPGWPVSLFGSGRTGLAGF